MTIGEKRFAGARGLDLLPSPAFASGAPGGLAWGEMQAPESGVNPEGTAGARSPIGQLRRLLGLGFGLAVIVGRPIMGNSPSFY